MAGNRLSEVRRCFSIIALALLLLTLFGSHLPWMEISEEGHIHNWQITESDEGNSNTDTATFYMDMYFNLLSVESCQTFQEDSAFFFKGQETCSVMAFSDADKYTTDVHDWSMYWDSCESAGLTSFALITAALGVLIVVVLFATMKNFQRKCCPDAYSRQHGRAKCVVPCCAAFSPLSAAAAVVLYFLQCIQDAQGKDVVDADDLSDVQRSATGYQGFWIAIAGAVSLLLWWLLFTIWFCRKNVEIAEIGGMASGGMTTNDVDTQPINRVGAYSDDDDSGNL